MDIRQRPPRPPQSHRRPRRIGRQWLIAATLLVSAGAAGAVAAWPGGHSAAPMASVALDAATGPAGPAAVPASATAPPGAAPSTAVPSPSVSAPAGSGSPSAAKSSTPGGPTAGQGSGGTAGSTGSGGSAGGGAGGGGAASGDAAQAVLDVINKARADQGLPALSVLAGLTGSAGLHSQAMAGGCGLSHQCPGEAAVGARESAQGVHWSSAGENIGTGGPVNGSQAVADMAVRLTRDMLAERPPNDGHRRNILSTSFTRIGISVIQDSAGTVWMTQDFSG